MLTLAAVDVGSNAVRLLMVRLSPLGARLQATFRRYALRLGGDVFARGSVGAEKARELEAVFKDVAMRMRRRGVTQYRAVATSAMRDAQNRRDIVRRLKKVSGLRLEVISGVEEARLSRDALAASLGWVPPATLLVDLGGGSLEVQRASAALGRSLPFGTVRLVQKYPALLTRLDRRGVETLSRLIAADLERRLSKFASAPLAVGTGGNFDALARLLPDTVGLFGGIDVGRLADFAVVLGRTTPRERIRRYRLRPDRADVILPAALVILALVRIFSIERFVVPGTGLRDALIHELAARSPAAVHARALAVQHSPTAHLARLAERLFILLTPLHRLESPAQLPLLVAAHGQASALNGAGSRGLTRGDRQVARALSAVLGLARELADRGVKDVTSELTREHFTLRAGLRRPVSASVLRALAAALKADLRIR